MTKIIGYILIFVVTLNFMLSASCFFIYKQGFNIGMMISILETNVSESLSMIKTLLLPMVISAVFFFVLSVIFIRGGKLCENKRYTKLWNFVTLIWLILPLAFYIKHKYISNKGGGFMVKSIIYHLVDLKGALELKDQISEIQNNKVKYNFINVKNEPIENIVILIGESARKNNLSLYGYGKNTTPFVNREKKNMLLYKNAYAPASITNLAVPIVLSNIDIDSYSKNITKLSDNILNVANHLGYDTYWLSTQGGAHGITAIASFAHTKKWLNGFDNILIPELKMVLSKSDKKKLIILHINGSHPYACDRYPQNEVFWNGGLDECYDNSIRYTDKVMGQIFQELRNRSYFIWFSDKIDSKKKGTEVLELTSTSTLYSNVLNLMGVKNPKTIDNTGKFLKLDLKSINYKDLE